MSTCVLCEPSSGFAFLPTRTVPKLEEVECCDRTTPVKLKGKICRTVVGPALERHGPRPKAKKGDWR